MTAVALGNPLRLGAIPYDDLTKDYFGQNGVIKEDSNGTGTQAPAFANGDCLAGTALAEGGARFASLSLPPAPPRPNCAELGIGFGVVAVGATLTGIGDIVALPAGAAALTADILAAAGVC